MNTETKTRNGSLITTRKIISHEHLNPNGILFGGYLMCWIDEIAFMCACRFTGRKSCVTVNIDNISFKYPLKLGEQIFLSAQVNHAGKSSMEVEVKVEKESTENGERVHTNNAFLTFVCLDDNFKPTSVPALKLESEEDERAFWQARLRVKIRKRLARFLERKIDDNNFKSKKPVFEDDARGIIFRTIKIKKQFRNLYSSQAHIFHKKVSNHLKKIIQNEYE